MNWMRLSWRLTFWTRLSLSQEARASGPWQSFVGHLAFNSTRGSSPPQRSKPTHPSQQLLRTSYHKQFEKLAIVPQSLSNGVPRAGLIHNAIAIQSIHISTFLSRIIRTVDIRLLNQFWTIRTTLDLVFAPKHWSIYSTGHRVHIGRKGRGIPSMMASSAAAGFLGRGSSGNNSNMRGLVQFIADLRNARARELEEKRINKELANIRFVLNCPWNI